MTAERRERDPSCLFCRIVAGEMTSDRVLEPDMSARAKRGIESGAGALDRRRERRQGGR